MNFPLIKNNDLSSHYIFLSYKQDLIKVFYSALLIKISYDNQNQKRFVLEKNCIESSVLLQLTLLFFFLYYIFTQYNLLLFYIQFHIKLLLLVVGSSLRNLIFSFPCFFVPKGRAWVGKEFPVEE